MRFADFDKLVALGVERDHDLVDDASLGVSEEGGRVSFGEALRLALEVVVVLWDGHGLADDHVVAGDAEAGRDDAVVVQFVVDGVAHAWKGLTFN